MRTRWMLLPAVAALCACGGPGTAAGPATSTKAPAAAKKRAADSLLNYIPHDTPFAFVPDESGGNQFSARAALDELRVQMQPLTVKYTAVEIAAMKPHERLGLVAARMLVELDDLTLKRIGIGNANTRGTIYGWGLVPVVRITLDGALLQKLFEDAAREAGLGAEFEDWHGKRFVRWTLGGVEVVVLFDEFQVAAALAHRAEDVLPHLAGEAMPERSFEPATVAHADKLPGKLVMVLDPSRIAALLRAGGLRPIVDAPAACGPALAEVVEVIPPMIGTTVGDPFTALDTHFLIGPTPDLARRLAGTVRPIPSWPRNPPPPDVGYVGMGVSPLPAVEATGAWVEEVFQAATACGAPASSFSLRDMLRAASVPLGSMRAFSMVFHTLPEGEPMPFQTELIADVSDPMALYQWMASVLHLPPKPPALDRPTRIMIGFMPATITFHRSGLSGSFGRQDDDALAALRTAPPGPTALLRMAHTAGPLSKSSSNDRTFDMLVTVEGDFLRLDYDGTP